MKHIVRAINTKTYTPTEKYLFDTAADAIEYAMTMNEVMKATDLRYRYCNESYHLAYINSRGREIHKTFDDMDDAIAFTAILDKRIERGTCGGYTMSS